MKIKPAHLIVKRSGLPGAGKGLFTKVFIPKGTSIVEYKGNRTTWKEVDHKDGENGYIYFISRKNVIDASKTKSALARYANDARGLQRVKGLLNNSEYREEGSKVYIVSTKDIPARGEIFVGYGKEYWEVIRHNIKVENARQKAKKAR